MKPAILIVALALSSMPLRAQACADMLDLGTLPVGAYSHAYGVSADGSAVVGSSYAFDPVTNASYNRRAFRWTAAGGMQDLGLLGIVGNPSSGASGVSADGSVVVGWSTFGPIGSRPFRWTAAGGMQNLGTLGGTFWSSGASGVSADGSVVVGGSYLANGDGRAFRWTAAGGMQDLGTLGGARSWASGVSADGSVVVGSSSLANGDYHAFRWTAAGGMQDLGTLGARSWAYGVSADGSVVVGCSVLANGDQHAFRWTAAGGMQDLGTLGGDDCYARGVSADGSVVVGGSTVTAGGIRAHAFRWTAAGGMQDLGTLGGTSSYSDAWGVSADGSVVVGGSGLVNGRPHAFRVQSSVMGTTYCRPTVENSTGCGGIVLANGDPRLATGALDLTATLLPMNSFGFFLTSQMQGNVVNSGGSQGTLCLGGNLGRFDAPGQVMNAGASGTFTLTVDLNALPTPTGLVAAQPGETWNFQAWHRDANPTLTSNFTDAVSIQFQ